MNIKIKTAKVHEEMLKDPEINREITDIQKFFDSENFGFAKDTINFVFVKGIYSHIKRSMLVVGVYVNNLDKSVYGIGSSLRLKFKNENAQIAVMNAAFDEKFMGELKPNEGMLLHLEIPVRGLEHDAEFSVKDIEGSLNNIQLVYEPMN